jgi:hypothetical protein
LTLTPRFLIFDSGRKDAGMEWCFPWTCHGTGLTGRAAIRTMETLESP